MSDNLLSQTLDLLRCSGATVADISRATGLKPRWLHRLKAGDFEDPGVTKIETLHRYLMAHADRDRPTADARVPTDAGNQTPASTAGAAAPTVDGEAA